MPITIDAGSMEPQDIEHDHYLNRSRKLLCRTSGVKNGRQLQTKIIKNRILIAKFCVEEIYNKKNPHIIIVAH